MTEDFGYRVDVIDTGHKPLSDENIKAREACKRRINLYTLIQRHCTRPAYFWFNYKWHVFAHVEDTECVSVNTEEALERGWYFEILRELAQGTVVPQKWCDAN